MKIDKLNYYESLDFCTKNESISGKEKDEIIENPTFTGKVFHGLKEIIFA